MVSSRLVSTESASETPSEAAVWTAVCVCVLFLFIFQDVERRNTELEGRVQATEKTLASSREEQQQAEGEVRRIIKVLDVKICDLSDLRQSLAKLIDK